MNSSIMKTEPNFLDKAIKNGLVDPEGLRTVLEFFKTGLSATQETVQDIKRNLRNTSEKVRELDEEAPLNPAEADDISKAVKAKGCEVLGGRKSRAYNLYEPTPGGKKAYTLRERVFKDIYLEIKRNYDMINPETGAQLSYKKLRRKYFKGAMNIIENYEPGISLLNDIEAENELDCDD